MSSTTTLRRLTGRLDVTSTGLWNGTDGGDRRERDKVKCLRVLVRSFGRAILWFGRWIWFFRVLAFGRTRGWVVIRGCADITLGLDLGIRLGVAESMCLGKGTLSAPKRSERQRREVYNNTISSHLQRIVDKKTSGPSSSDRFSRVF